jgi:Tfp pilus assembly PilM family ATPase
MVFGSGLLYQRSFDFGGGLITYQLMEEFDIESYEIADMLKNKAMISVDSDDRDSYEIVKGDKALYFNKNRVKQVILGMLDELVEEIHACYTLSKVRVPDHIPLYITGGGIANIRGAKERLSDVIGVSVETLAPDLPFLDKPENSSYFAVLNYALNN